MHKLSKAPWLVLLMAPWLVPGGAAAKKPASVMLIPESLYLSPNQDGVNDAPAFQVKTDGVRDVMSWDVQFKDSAQIVRRTLSGLKNLPDTIIWDGRDEYGGRAPEGAYEAILKVWDGKNKFMEASVQKIVLDMTPPTLSLAAQDKRAYLNSDGSLSPITFYFSAVDLSGLKEWKIQFLDEKRQAFHLNSAQGALPASWIYSGTGLPAGTKKMVAILGVTDMAGNKAASPPLEIEFVSETERRAPLKMRSEVPPPPQAPKEIADADAGTPESSRKASTPGDRGPYLQMTSILFVSDLFGEDADDQSPLLGQAEVLLSPLAQALLDAPGSRATLIGHVDNAGGAAAAKTLSSYFAWKVFSYFVKDKGVDKNTLSVKGLGADVPIADNRTALGRTRNRRIEIQLFMPRNRS